MSEASKLIRASIAALHVSQRASWAALYEYVNTADERTPVATADTALHWSRPEAEAVAAHIALLASPPVAAAVADLLDALRDLYVVDCTNLELLDAVFVARDALEAAITRTGSAS